MDQQRRPGRHPATAEQRQKRLGTREARVQKKIARPVESP